MKRDRVVFYLNGERREEGPERARMMLADYLRYERGLTGTKIVCAEGDCGACSVLRWFPYGEKYLVPVNSCIVTVAQMDGSSIVTVDALAGDGLTPVQEAMVSCHGSQCGYCTPGFVVAIEGLVEKKIARGENGSITEKEAKNALTGNLCRCTGYQPILDAAQSVPLSACIPLAKRFLTSAIQKDLRRAVKQAVEMQGEDFSLQAPADLSGLRGILAKSRDARFLAAGTDLGVQHNKRRIRLEKLVSLHLVEELYAVKKGKGRALVGARVTLSELRRRLEGTELARFLDLFASPQIKNVATLAGNVCNASPIADTPPFLLVADATVHLLGARGKRSVPLDGFFLAYRKTALRPGECITGIEFALPDRNDRVALFKSSQRKDLDISAVNAAFRLRMGARREVRVALGGVAAVPLRLKRVEKFLEASPLTAESAEKAVAILQDEIRPLSDLRGSAAFRRVLAANFLRRFLADCRGGGA